MAVRLAQEWFTICGGCEVTILDVGEPLLDILPKLEIVHMPVLMDHKVFGQMGEKTQMEIPEADVGIISGGIRTEENKELAKEMRKKCKTLIAMGSCACYGGIPALANLSTVADLYEKVYRDSVTTESNGLPKDELPPLTDRVYAIHEVVPVDVKLPGCPTTPELFVEAVTALLEGRKIEISGKSVCDECPFIREKKAVSTLNGRWNRSSSSPARRSTRCAAYWSRGISASARRPKPAAAGRKKRPVASGRTSRAGAVSGPSRTTRTRWWT
jgi:F420-non-reducing hydrogenase small subunit